MYKITLERNNDKYLLEQSTERDDFRWSIPGGYVLTKETAEIGLNRELKEELNIENINYKKVDTVKFPYNKYIFNVFYSEDNIDVDKLEFQEEVIQVNWFIKDEIINLLENVVVFLL